MKLGYTIVTEDAWVRKHHDKSTDIDKVLKLAKRYSAEIHQILLKGSWETIKKINALRPMVIPQKELKELYNKVYSWKRKEEYVINVDNRKQITILKEALNLLTQR